jgi:hypothetical protein
MTQDPHYAWLLEEDNPSVRYFTLRRLFDRSVEDNDVNSARKALMQKGPVPAILALQDPAGWWGNPENATKPMYTSTAWLLMALAELGADGSHPQIRKGCEIVLNTVQDESGAFPPKSTTFYKMSPSDMVCFDGEITWSLLRLGYTQTDPRLEKAVQFLGQALKDDCGRCHFNGDQPCAWGIIKALRALAELPTEERSGDILKGIETGAGYIMDNNLAQANYPTRPKGKTSDHWFKFGFPRNYQSDILEALVVLSDLGYAQDARLKPAIEFMKSKRRPDGTWKLEETLPKLPVPIEKKGPSKWITLYALSVLKAIEN